MGVTYKLREEVVHFIVSQRQSNPLASCRQLAESTSQKFGLHLSKSSVHDVLKESGIVTPRGRKPKNKFEIPQEKKKQIQTSLSQVKLSPSVPEEEQAKVILIADVAETQEDSPGKLPDPPQEDMQISPEYEGAGMIFLKAALWDLGIYSEENIKGPDWGYYLTYSKGIKVSLENNKSFFIDLPLPLERCINEVADGLINNVKPFIVNKVTDESLFKACMNVQTGFKISNISIVDYNDHILLEFNDIMEYKREFIFKNRVFVDNNQIEFKERSKSIFFPQIVDNDVVMEKILNLKGFDTVNKNENIVTLLINDGYENKNMLKEAAEKLNSMYLNDEKGRLVKVVINSISLREESALPKAGA
jgi:hypothetical protein